MLDLGHCTILGALILLIGGSTSMPIRAQEETRGVQIPAESPESGVRGYSNRHALVIGIDEYEDPAYPDLGHAVADARAVAKTLVDRFGFEADHVRLMLNSDATKDEIERVFPKAWARPEYGTHAV
jgi:hypothetical protein